MLARKFLAVVATALVSAGLYAGAAHSAGPVKIDVSRDKVTCTTVYGTVAFSPALTIGGTLPTRMTVKGTVDNCTDLTNPNVKLVKSTFAGTLSAPNNNALSLLGLQNVTGTITTKWKADKTSPILQTSTVMTPGAICGGLTTLPAPFNASQHGQFHIGGPSTCSGKSQPAPTATGAFSNYNNDGGASSVTDALTVQDVNALASGNVAGVNLALGTITAG
jgi:hypothetical protein